MATLPTRAVRLVTQDVQGVCRSVGTGAVTPYHSPVAGCSNASSRACSHCRVRPSRFASTGSAP